MAAIQQVLLSGGSGEGFPVDAVLELTSGPDGTLLTTGALDTATNGATPSWGLIDGSPLRHTKIDVSTFTAVEALKVRSTGATYRTSNRGIEFDLEEAFNNNLGNISAITTTGNPTTITIPSTAGISSGSRLRIFGVTGNSPQDLTDLIVTGTVLNGTQIQFPFETTVAGTGGHLLVGWDGFRSSAIIPPGTRDISVSALVYIDQDIDPSLTGNTDLLKFQSDNYAVSQISAVGGTALRYAYSHSEDGLGLRIQLSGGTWYEFHVRYNDTEQLSEVMIFNATTGALVGTSAYLMAGTTDVSYFEIADYLGFFGGRYVVKRVALDWTAAAFPQRLNWTLPAPSSLLAAQTDNSEITLTFNALGYYVTIERHSSATGNWTSLGQVEAATLNDGSFNCGPCELVDTGLTDGVTYKYRAITSIVGTDSALSSESNSVTISNVDTPTAQDDFQSYADGTSLDSTPNWVGESGDFNVTGAVSKSVFFANAGGGTAVVRNVATLANDQRVTVTLPTLGSSFQWAGPMVRAQAGAVSGYGVVASATAICLFKVIAGTRTELANVGSLTIAANDMLEIIVTGSGASTRLTVKINGSDVVGAVSIDPGGTYLNSGFGGITGWQFAEFLAKVDNWKAYDL